MEKQAVFTFSAPLAARLGPRNPLSSEMTILFESRNGDPRTVNTAAATKKEKHLGLRTSASSL
jgi:hypothetical protein